MSAPELEGRRLRLVALVAGALTAILLISACTSQPKSQLSDAPSEAVSADSSRTLAGIHGSDLLDALDDPAFPCEPLDVAVAKSRLKLSLPDQAAAGKVVKTVVVGNPNDDPAGTARAALGILYDSGVKMWIEPGAENLTKSNEAHRGTMIPFKDGRELPRALRKLAGRSTLVGNPGVISAGRSEEVFPADLIFNIDDVRYWLRAPVRGERIGVEELIEIAESMAPVNSGD